MAMVLLNRHSMGMFRPSFGSTSMRDSDALLHIHQAQLLRRRDDDGRVQGGLPQRGSQRSQDGTVSGETSGELTKAI